MNVRVALVSFTLMAGMAGASAALAERLAQAPPGPAPAEAAEARGAASDAALIERVSAFVDGFYLSGERRSDEELAQLYAARVAYFSNRVPPRERILADKRAYYARWPRRDYRLIRETLRVEKDPAQPRVLDVTFEYEFDVASGRRVSRGRGLGMLTLDLTQDGGRITRETGVVLKRW